MGVGTRLAAAEIVDEGVEISPSARQIVLANWISKCRQRCQHGAPHNLSRALQLGLGRWLSVGILSKLRRLEPLDESDKKSLEYARRYFDGELGYQQLCELSEELYTFELLIEEGSRHEHTKNTKAHMVQP